MFGVKTSTRPSSIIRSASIPDYQFTPAQQRYLEILQCAEHDWSISRICTEAGIHRASYYRWQREPGFAYQLAKVAVRHISVSAPVFFARAMNSALEGGRPVVWNSMFRFLTTPRAMEALQANLAALAQLAASEGESNTKKWDANQDLGPHHRAAAREKLLTVGRSSEPRELEDFYEPAARASREKSEPEAPRSVASAPLPPSHPLAGVPPLKEMAHVEPESAKPDGEKPEPVVTNPGERLSWRPGRFPWKSYHRELLSRNNRCNVRLVLAGARLRQFLLPGQLILA